ncbi:MAG: glycoside hydrolase family 15 protein [Candidatus Pacebacteria bacterium]|nr:glycoside hydrolase family 15 protein [Candidatus Paceibacterota bacterium]
MPRALVLGNGETVVCLDRFGFVRDFYFPYVGLENHVSGNKHRIGFMIDGQFTWLDDGTWQINIGYKPETMVGYLVCKNEEKQISIVMEDCVYNESNVFLRQVEIYNHRDDTRDVKVFFHQVFLIQENKKRNTAFYDPTHNAVVHYRGRRIFIVNGRTADGHTIDDFSVGAYNYEGHEGTYRDAEDGELGKNGVEHGSVDSTIRFCIKCEGKKKSTLYYWIAAAKTLDDVYALNTMVMNKTPQGMLSSTEDYWHAWLDKRNFDFEFLTKDQKKLFNTSLYILRAHTDNRGSIIASADSAMIEYGKDDYAYMWPRDAAFIVSVLDSAGFTEATKNFFKFCKDVLHEDGYLHHRFNADQSLGSTWHSPSAQSTWLKDKKLQLPIQEDETASVLYSLWHHYEQTKDIEFIEDLYKQFIEKMADFLVEFRNKDTGLPLPSYDLWEEVIGVSTYTCASVYGGLMAAAKFSELLGKRNHMRKYRQAAKEVKKATVDYLYSGEKRSFIRYVECCNGDPKQIQVVDSSSLFGLWYFGMFDQDDPLFQNTHQRVQELLINPGQTGGFIRYENDAYFRSREKSNPWFITTLWEVQRRLANPKVTEEDFDFARQVFTWVESHLYPSGVLAEQLDPDHGDSLSATPLVWSHAEYVRAVLLYQEALIKLGKVKEESASIIHEL